MYAQRGHAGGQLARCMQRMQPAQRGPAPGQSGMPELTLSSWRRTWSMGGRQLPGAVQAPDTLDARRGRFRLCSPSSPRSAPPRLHLFLPPHKDAPLHYGPSQTPRPTASPPPAAWQPPCPLRAQVPSFTAVPLPRPHPRPPRGITGTLASPSRRPCRTSPTCCPPTTLGPNYPNPSQPIPANRRPARSTTLRRKPQCRLDSTRLATGAAAFVPN
jgi:hypothetical protein